MLKRIIFSLGCGLVIALICAWGFPSLQRIVSPILCYDGQLIEVPPDSSTTLDIACKRGATQTAIGFVPYLGVATLGYGIIALIVIGLVGEPIAQSFRQGKLDQQRRLELSIPAPATIVDVRDGGMAVSTGAIRRVKLALDLQIMPETGEPFTTTVRWMISELHFSRVQPGCVVKVKIDPDDPQQVYPMEEWIKG